MSSCNKLILLFLSVVCISCHSLVETDFPDFEKQLTVNSFLVHGDILNVHVSYADKLDTGRLASVDNATVELYTNNDFSHALEYVSNGVYKSTTVIEQLHKYTCKVHVPNYDEVECTQTLPSFPVIHKVEHINVAGKDEEGTSYPAIKLSFENNLTKDEYYEVVIRNIRTFRDEVNISEARIHTIVDPVILNEGLPIALFSNELISASKYTLTLNYTTDGSSSRNNGPFRTDIYPFVVELRKITKDYYRFKKQLFLYEEGRYADGIMTSMTNTNLYSNIDNGYGIFSGYSFVVSDTITPNTDGYYE